MIRILFVLISIINLAGCGKEVVRYGDARAIETVTNEFGSTDLQMIAGRMTQSLLMHPLLVGAESPVFTVQEVKNKTSEYIDTRAITDSVRSELVKSGKVKFAVDSTGMVEQIEELNRQQGELYERKHAVKTGRMIGAHYRMEGNITSIVKKAEGTRDVYYKFNLQVWEIESGLLAWNDEKEIRKTTTRE